MESFDLLILFTTAGALVGATLVKTLVSAGKGLGLLPDSGRVLLFAVLALSAGLVGLALTANPPFLADGFNGQDVLIVVLSVIGIYTAAPFFRLQGPQAACRLLSSMTPFGIRWST